MNTINPRFEFRVFALDLHETEQLIKKKGLKPRIRQSKETYIVSPKSNTYNAKIRHELLDIKKLLKTENGLEQWSPVLKEFFPLSKEIIEEILNVFGIDPLQKIKPEYSQSEFFEEIVQEIPDLYSVKVKKHRWGYMINNCICELADVYIEDMLVKTAAVESTVTSNIIETVRILQLDQYENTNYQAAIKELIKMSG